MIEDSAIENDDQASAEPEEDNSWISMARDAHEQSTDWFDASLRRTTEKALAHFSNRHAPGSKYHSESYKYRSKSFRPKTRATIRRNEAAAAVAFFSTQDMVSVTAENEADPKQQLSAKVISELLNYRLDDSIPWFLTLIGGYQDALNTGVCISHNYWDFDETVEQFEVMGADNLPMLDDVGQPKMQEQRQIVTDKPCVDLVAIENFRISPASDWADPIGTTPYIIELIPMFIGDVKAKMVAGKWHKYDDGAIQTAAEAQYDSVRSAREGKRADKDDVTHATTDFDTVWVHRNIVRRDGEDWLFYTLGVLHMLTDPIPLNEQYRHLRKGERPYTMGGAIIESHKPFPVGLNELTFGLQEDANDINNQRRDNVSLVMNKRYFAKRTANVDYKSLTRNVPGSVTLVDDIQTDIRWDSPPEVTGSSYQEQDRVSLDFDELAGAFSPGSVQSNRKLGETVGGMSMLSGEANAITEYQLRVFAETWVEPTLKQLARLEQAYETDPVVMAIAGQKAHIERFGIDQVTDDMLRCMVTVRVNVGFGSTNPQQRVQKLAMGLDTVGKFAPQLMQGLDAKEVISEVFGALGYKGADRFFPQLSKEADPQLAQMQKQIQELQSILQTKQAEIQGRIEVENVRQQGNIAVEQLRVESDDKDRQLEQMRLEMEAQLAGNELSSEERRDLERQKVLLASLTLKLQTQRQLSQESMAHSRDITTAGHMVDLHKNRQALPAPSEPYGKAEPGMAFTQ